MSYGARPCAECGKPMHRHAQASYCFPCAASRIKSRISTSERTRPAEKAKKINGVCVCIDCDAPLKQPVYNGKKRRTTLRCFVCNQQHWMYRELLTGKAIAGHAVSNAKRRGDLPPLSELRCADCGKPAECYDHRDYNHPLRVEAVCRSCNVVRGPAIPFNPLLVGLLLIAASQPA